MIIDSIIIIRTNTYNDAIILNLDEVFYIIVEMTDRFIRVILFAVVAVHFMCASDRLLLYDSLDKPSSLPMCLYSGDCTWGPIHLFCYDDYYNS